LNIIEPELIVAQASVPVGFYFVFWHLEFISDFDIRISCFLEYCRRLIILL
jgi:hypothetical protein